MVSLFFEVIGFEEAYSRNNMNLKLILLVEIGMYFQDLWRGERCQLFIMSMYVALSNTVFCISFLLSYAELLPPSYVHQPRSLVY